MNATPNVDLMCKLLSVMSKFQNDGKGHAFYTLSGHFSYIDIRIYIGEWDKNKEAEIYRTVYSEESIKRAIHDIEKLHKNTPDFETLKARQKEKDLQRRKEQYELLKKEFEG